MFCQLCGQPLGAGSINNICQSCSSALGNTGAKPSNSSLPSHLRFDAPEASSGEVNPDREWMNAIQQLNNKVKSAPSPVPSLEPTPVSRSQFTAPVQERTNSARPTSTERGALPYTGSPFAAVATCSRCGHSYALERMYRVHNRNFLSKAPKTAAICRDCMQILQREWRKSQSVSQAELAVAALVSLVFGVGLSLLWAWSVSVTYQVTVFVIVLIGLGMGSVMQRVLRNRKGPLPGMVVGAVTFLTLILAFYFLYSQLGGSVVSNLTDFTQSLQRNGLPVQTIAYFVLALAISIGLNLAFEPEVYDSQGQRVAMS